MYLSSIKSLCFDRILRQVWLQESGQYAYTLPIRLQIVLITDSKHVFIVNLYIWAKFGCARIMVHSLTTNAR